MSHPDRKKTYVDPQVQGSLVRRLILHWVGFFVVASLIAFFLQVMSNPFRSFEAHATQIWWTHGPFILAMVFLLPVFVLDTLRLSNRFAGPIYRLRKTIRTIAQGESAQPLKFRDGDFWQSLATDFNQMVDQLTSSEESTDKNHDEQITATSSNR